MTDVWTSRLGVYRAPDYLDVSLQGNTRHADAGEVGGHRGIGLAFCPSPGLLFPYLSKRRFGRETPEDWLRYAATYTQEMRGSWRTCRDAWDLVLSWDEVTLLCFCTDPRKCHRTVLAELLGKVGGTVRGERATVTG